jgi:hypothetical protein
MAALPQAAHPDHLWQRSKDADVNPTEAENIANELAGMIAREHRRTKIEQGRREAAESIAADLAALLAHDHADLERERSARLRAEAELRDLVSPEDERTPRFVPAARPPRRLQRVH